jgi:hypothetical protein
MNVYAFRIVLKNHLGTVVRTRTEMSDNEQICDFDILLIILINSCLCYYAFCGIVIGYNQ